MDRWSQLSMSEKSDLMSLYIKNCISSLEEIKKHYNSFDTGGHLYQDGGPDNPLRKYANLVRTPQVAVADNTRYTAPITDVDIDRAQGLPRGTTTLRREIATKTNPVISQNITPEETQNQINRVIRTQKVLEPLNQTLDVIENVPVVGDAVTVGRAASDATHGDYTAASLLPLMWLGNKLPFGKTGVKQAAKLAENTVNYTDELRKFIANNRNRIDAERALGHGFDSFEVDQALKYYKDTFNIDLTRQEANDLLTARYLNLRDATSGLAEGQRLGIVHNPHTWNTSFNLFNNANEEIGHMAVHKQPNEPKYYVAGVSNKTLVKDETGKIIGTREHKVARDLYDMLLDVENTPFITGQDLLNPQATMNTILKDGYTRTLRPDLKHLWMGDVIIDGKKIEPMASEITSHTPREINNVAKSLLFEPSILEDGIMNIDLKGGLYKKFGGELK